MIIIYLLGFSYVMGRSNDDVNVMKEFSPSGKIEALINEMDNSDYLLIQLDLKNDSLFNLVNTVLPDLDLFSGPASYHRIMKLKHLEKIKNVINEDYYSVLNENYVFLKHSREYWMDFKQGGQTQGTWSDDDAIEYTCSCLSGASDCVKLGWDESWYNPLDYWGEAWYGFQPPYYQFVEEIRVTVRGGQCDALPIWSETYMGMMDGNGNWSQDYELSIDYTDNEFIVSNTWNGETLMPRIGSEDNYCIDNIKLEFYYSCESPDSPINLIAADEENCQTIDLNWTLPSSSINQQILYRDEVAIAQLGPLDVAYEDWGAQAGLEHEYCIEAYNECGNSMMTCDNGSIKTVPNSPISVIASDGAYDAEVLVSWSNVENTENYKIYRDGSWMGITTFDQLQYVDIIPEFDIVYEYCIEALNECGESDWNCDTGYVNAPGGDINGDENIDVLDVVLMVNIIIGSHMPTSEELSSADMNHDGYVDILDIVILVNEIIRY